MLSNSLKNVVVNHVKFDPKNKKHREIAAKYVLTRSWRHTNTRFVVELPYTDVGSLVTAKLAEYYAKKEFSDT